jgi:HSP20 family protein
LSERWWRRGRKKRPWVNDFFDEFDRLDGIMDETIRKAFETASERKVRQPHVYGFSMSFESGEKPVIQGFGNVKPTQRTPQILREWEPLVDVFEENEAVVIVVELPGLERDDINVHSTENHLTVSVNTPTCRYHKELTLPATVKPRLTCAVYKNGVLEVRLKKWR